LDSDGSINISKGAGRPVFTQNIRAETIASLATVDFVFKIRKVFKFSGTSADRYYDDLVRNIYPDFIITHVSKDLYAKKKLDRAKKHSVRLLLRRENPFTSSTEIVEKLKRLD
jgi:bifunctional ADP-heptose synthase (sugar kinase/adenylyltransferase)